MKRPVSWSNVRRARTRSRSFALASVMALALSSTPSFALDKPGSSHGEVAGADSGVDVGGAATLGMSLYNPSDAARPDNTGRVLFRYALHSDIDLGRRLSIRYAARPDNSGSAPLRYALHTELSLLDDLVSFGLDGTFFTDRETRPLAPSELDLAPEINLHRAPYELHVAYERDMPLGSDAPDESALAAPQRGLVQSFVYALVVWSFDLGHHSATESLEERTQVPSP